jgi:hypothetical protein
MLDNLKDWYDELSKPERLKVKTLNKYSQLYIKSQYQPLLRTQEL